MRFESPETLSTKRQRKHGGYKTYGFRSLAMKNKGVIITCVMDVPFFRACAVWKGHVVGHHSTVY
jgi:hypothetical protein